jgi:hypothetical protein
VIAVSPAVSMALVFDDGAFARESLELVVGDENSMSETFAFAKERSSTRESVSRVVLPSTFPFRA